MVNSCAPVVLFLYNRPKHTVATLRNLSLTVDAENTELYIFCDGPKMNSSREDLDNISKVRKIAECQNGFKKVIVACSDINKGLGQSILNGVSEVVNKFGRCIVLEDDHIVHSDFIRYMNYYLDTYENEERVMHISAFSRNSFLQFFMPTVFFTRYMDCGGWATWSESWNKLQLNFKLFDDYFSIEYNKNKYNFNKLNHHNFLYMNKEVLKTWAVFWHSTIAIHNGLCLMSKFSYVKNIGNDGSGTNGVVKTTELASNFVKRFKPNKPRLLETRLSELYIQDAYAKRSKKRLTTPKRWLHDILSNLRNSLYKPTI